MKNLISLIIGLLVMGCGKQEQTDTNESTPTTNTNKVDGTTAKPVKELTKEDVAGTYEHKDKAGRSFKLILLGNGIVEGYTNGKKNQRKDNWKIINKEIHFNEMVCGINEDGTFTMIAIIFNGKREELPKEDQVTFKKIK